MTTPSGAKIEYTTALVVKMDYSHLKKDYLSDLTPSTVEQRFRLVAEERTVEQYRDWRCRGDKNLDDRPLELNNVPYEKGLALHSHTELVYDLNGDYREFHAVVGIDREVAGSPAGRGADRGRRHRAGQVHVRPRRQGQDGGAAAGDEEHQGREKAAHHREHLDTDKMNDVGLKAVLADAFVSK